jgi:hypothetical protein
MVLMGAFFAVNIFPSLRPIATQSLLPTSTLSLLGAASIIFSVSDMILLIAIASLALEVLIYTREGSS